MHMLRSRDDRIVALSRSVISSICLVFVWQVGFKDSDTLKSNSESQGNYLRFLCVRFCCNVSVRVTRCTTCTNSGGI